MQTISQMVWELVSADQISLDYLKRGLLNASAYAELIKPEIEQRLLLQVSTSSIVTALSRIRQNHHLNLQSSPKFKIDDLSFKLPITELVYKKDRNPNPALATIYKQLGKIDDLYLNIVNVTNELDIFVSSGKAELVKACLTEFDLLHEERQLSALILKYNSEFRNYSGMGSQVLNALAVRSVIVVEYLTTFSEFIIYINQAVANQAVDILHREFMR